MIDDSGARSLRFSERHGYKEVSSAIQHERLSDETRNGIWNAIVTYPLEAQYWVQEDGSAVWTEHFSLRVDSYSEGYLTSRMKKTVTAGEWYEVFDLVEALIGSLAHPSYFTAGKRFNAEINRVLTRDRAAYRIVESLIVPITNDAELESLQTALSEPKSPAQKHLQKALELFADRESPDYANSIKESISAAEAASQSWANQPGETMGKALDTVRKNGDLHPALVEGWKKLYGFTADSGGIRHALTDGSLIPTEELAQYFLITCSAFVNLATTQPTAN
ncbi:hypothetical protein IUQ79_20825 [Mycobacteroides abscessus subsp. bolletii]|uniref:AbiJ-NTD4 domain-containing protein n=1 Tax=Mycobacteroides abscessus TaxID=36809 RepID=UPI0019D13B48|nr:hypothetical protein [Mycobacteroides abscessus]MBN7304344.1 hypothetical protein [Mycobacteroides abscessus subsp. bolletii]